MVWMMPSLNFCICWSSSSDRLRLGDVLEDAHEPADLPVGPAIGRLDEDDVVLAVRRP